MMYSYSRINTYKTCPLKFKYTYLEKPDIEVKENIEAFMGSRVHDTLEKLYGDLRLGRLNTIDELLSFYDNNWNENYTDSIEIVKEGITSENYRELGKEYIRNYYEAYKPFNQGKTLGLEMQISLKIIDSSADKVYNLQGFIDRLTLLENNKFEIHDYKTNNRTKTQQELDVDEQLALYSIAVKEMYQSAKEVDLVWHFLASGLEIRSIRSDFQLENLKKDLVKIIREIELAQEKDCFSAKESVLCDWCEYKGICPAKAHEIKLKALPKNEYLAEDGVKLVNRYAELMAKKKKFDDDADKELEKLKEAIIEYSKKNSFERVYGSNGSILVKEYDSIKFPEKNTLERERLEQLIKDNGLWNEFSELSCFGLLNGIKQNMFSEDFLKLLDKHLKKEKISRLYLSWKA